MSGDGDGVTVGEFEPWGGARAGDPEDSPASERDQVLVSWNDTARPFPEALCIHELVEAQAAARPEATAVIFGETALSYGALNARSNRLARRLVALGVAPDVRVAICVERSLEMVVGVLAVLKAGGAYVPLDPTYPADRLAYMLEDSAARVVLTHGPARAALEPAMAGLAAVPQVVDLDADAADWADAAADDLAKDALGLTSRHLAYVIYTSGSTGRPKGVMVEHRSVVNLCQSLGEMFRITCASRMLQFASASVSTPPRWEIWGALSAGARVVLCRGGAPWSARGSRRRSNDWPRRLQCCRRWSPTPFRQRRTSAQRRCVLLVGGEAVSMAARRLADAQPRCPVFNAYGPTEATVCTTVHPCASATRGPPPIGRPIANARVYVLDRHLQPCPLGVSGELWIGGAGVARGYLNRPDLTAERFIDSPFVAGDRLYRTGDLARWLADGTLEYLGRNDFQVKIRGFRIELGEIEARLADHPAVRAAAVLAREDTPGEARLVAYYTLAGDVDPGPGALRAHLAAQLADYMAPSAYLRLEAFPLTPNGKLDRAALPAPDGQAYAVSAYEPPEGPVEEALAAIWADVLGLERVGRHDNFFNLGGHSLLAIRATSRLRDEMAVGAMLTELLTQPRLADFARLLAVQRSLPQRADFAGASTSRLSRCANMEA